jgi:regulator of RNase E activity RraA
MSGRPLTPEARRKLAEAGVSTLTTCLHRHGLQSVWLKGVVPAGPIAAPMVGEAFTLRFVPAREDVGGMASYAEAPSIHQRAFEECPPGHVLVIDARGEVEACTCGSLLIARLKVRGGAGIVTDGGFRDSIAIATLGFPAYHRGPAPPPSFTRLHAVELNGPIGCAGVAVYPGDVMVGDAEGVLVLPARVAEDVAAEAVEMARYEAFAAAKIRDGHRIYGLYPAGDAALAEYRLWARKRDEGA